MIDRPARPTGKFSNESVHLQYIINGSVKANLCGKLNNWGHPGSQGCTRLNISTLELWIRTLCANCSVIQLTMTSHLLALKWNKGCLTCNGCKLIKCPFLHFYHVHMHYGKKWIWEIHDQKVFPRLDIKMTNKFMSYKADPCLSASWVACHLISTSTSHTILEIICVGAKLSMKSVTFKWCLVHLYTFMVIKIVTRYILICILKNNGPVYHRDELMFFSILLWWPKNIWSFSSIKPIFTQLTKDLPVKK